MRKFRVDRHKQANHFGSTHIIVDSITAAAKKVDLYSDKEEDYVYYYDCLADDHGERADALIVAYELNFPRILLERLAGRPCVGLSKENAALAVWGGYPASLTHYVSLGVDSKIWYYTKKKYNKDKFVFLSFVESNSRSGLEILVPVFCETFAGNKGVKLLLKDREATPLFKTWVKEMATAYDVDIEHHDSQITNFEDQVKYYESADVHINLNHAHTWGQVVSQGMSCGVPTVVPRYSGFSDYCSELNSLCVNFELVPVTNDVLQNLVNIGMKNHLIPITPEQYIRPPVWAETDKSHLKQLMIELSQVGKGTLNKYSELSRMTAEWFSWERTCYNYSYLIDNMEYQNIRYNRYE